MLARKDRGGRGPKTRSLTHSRRPRTWTARLRRTAPCALGLGVLCAAAVALPQAALAAPTAPAVTFTPLTLLHGWGNAPYSTANAAVTDVGGIVEFKGAISTSGTNHVPFILPAAFRPAANVYVPVDLCNASNGRLLIRPDGVVTVTAETRFANAACFTSLDGASFAKSATSFTPLALRNGWRNAPYGTSDAAVRVVSGTVHFKGAIWTGGTSSHPFTLPAGFRPPAYVYVPVDLCRASKGRLGIAPSGTVTVQAETRFSNAACFTSLDGASFALSAASFTPLTLENGWYTYPDTAQPAVRVISGIVSFEGAMETPDSDSFAFILPVGFRPATDVYVPVDLCDAHNGRLEIEPDGGVTVTAQGGRFSRAACFTSLDGAWFAQ